MDFNLRFLGAAGNVTGSRTLLTFENKSFLIDCGLFQGPKELRERNWAPFLKDAAALESVFLTHAHLDHSGYLPKLYREGFRGAVHSSAGTRALSEILLRDAAKLQEEDAEYANRTGHSKHSPALPLYTMEDAEGALGCVVPHARDEWFRVGSNLGTRFIRSGHIVGSSFVQFSIGGGNSPLLVTFSGDVGHHRSRILRGPDPVPETDILILESTYGNRLHPAGDVADAFADVIRRTIERKGVLVIPAFAVGRAQELIFLMKVLEDSGRIPSVPVVLDSPMAISATEAFLAHPEDHLPPYLFTNEAKNFFPRQFRATQSRDDSFLACMEDGPLVVISASGMLSGGRVLHHLKKRLPDPRNTLLFAGYQAEGSKGRFLLDNAKTVGSVRIHHQEIPIAAEIVSLEGLSAHGDAHDLIEWLGGFRRPPKKVILNHGTKEAAAALAQQIRDRLGWPDVHPLASEEAFSFST